MIIGKGNPSVFHEAVVGEYMLADIRTELMDCADVGGGDSIINMEEVDYSDFSNITFGNPDTGTEIIYTE